MNDLTHECMSPWIPAIPANLAAIVTHEKWEPDVGTTGFAGVRPVRVMARKKSQGFEES